MGLKNTYFICKVTTINFAMFVSTSDFQNVNDVSYLYEF